LQESTANRADILAALDRVQAWPGLSRSPQLAKFLNYIVNATLDGNEAGIKAYAIAVDVFGRPANFDPQSDPIVRVQARRLRAALDEYYADEGCDEAVRFYLPVGRYVPEFRVAGGQSAVEMPESTLSTEPPDALAPPARAAQIRPFADILGLVGVVFATLVIAVVMTQLLASRPVAVSTPIPPRVAVAEFTSIASSGAPAVSVAGLAVELVSDLELFPFIDAYYLPRLDPGASEDDSMDFELSGIARIEQGNIQLTASLKQTDTGTVVWSRTQIIEGQVIDGHIDDLSRGIVDHLAAIGSPLYARDVAWIEAQDSIEGKESSYVCGLLFGLHRNAPDLGLRAKALACVSALVRDNPVSAIPLAMSGALMLEQALAATTGSIDAVARAEIERQIRSALLGLPNSSFVWREWARYLSAVGRITEAQAAFTSALQLNPADLDATSMLAKMLLGRGESEQGRRLAEQAIARAAVPPYWYYAPLGIDELRRGENGAALLAGEQLSVGDPELGSIIATVAAERLGDDAGLNRNIPQMLEVNRLRRFGIVPVLRQRIPDGALRTAIEADLLAAGIDRIKINGPF